MCQRDLKHPQSTFCTQWTPIFSPESNQILSVAFFDAKAPGNKTKPCGWSATRRELQAYTQKHQKTLTSSLEDVCEREPGFCDLSDLWYLMWSRCESEDCSTPRRASWGDSQHRNTRTEWGGRTDGGGDDEMRNRLTWLKHFQAPDTLEHFKRSPFGT